jgi:hypothetical protein
MIYFANPSTQPIRDEMLAGRICIIKTPNSTRDSQQVNNTPWIADNGAFSDRFDEPVWWAWLQKQPTALCYFAVAPDVYADAKATLNRSTPWLPRIRSLGYPAAFVAQDGSDEHPPPWDDLDVLFIGGTTAFKLGPVARQLITEARAKGKWVHCGRINSERRYKAMASLGCHSCDGTYLVFGPDINLPKLLGWLHRYHAQLPLFEVT